MLEILLQILAQTLNSERNLPLTYLKLQLTPNPQSSSSHMSWSICFLYSIELLTF